VATWRALPLTAQLGVVGMAVMLSWFLVARAAAEEQEGRRRARYEEVRSARSAEVVITRMGTALAAMSAAQRGYLVMPRPTELVQLEAYERVFRLDMQALRQRWEPIANIRGNADRLDAQVRRWTEEVVQPNIELRARAGIAAFGEGSAGAARLLVGARMLDTARALHADILREIRGRALELEQQLETAQAMDELESFLILAAAVLVFLLIGTLILRFVARELARVISAAEALDAGEYDRARLPEAHLAPNREMVRLSTTFRRVAASIATRERQLQEDIERLQELERLKADFVSTVSHELRTPLTSMRGALGLILGGKVGEIPGRGRELLTIAMNNTERLIRLINDILDIEKMDAGHVTVRHDRLRIRPVVETSIAGLEGFARDADVRLELTSDDDAEIVGDTDRLVQVLTNLASNAVKFSPKGAAVELSIRRTGATVTVGVRDHGPGIPEEFSGRIFGRFQQAGGAESRQSGGTGLGLNIAKSIIELHGGRIGFEPAPGGGTLFWFSLPVAMAIVAAPDDVRHRVLVVEDDSSMRDVLTAQLEAFARPLAAGSAEDALDLLEQESVSAIILDPGLPGMDGFAFVRRLRSDDRFRRLPILIFSASELSAEVLHAAGVRAADVFVKSRDNDEVLFERLRTELRHPR
jgi:signal transduction histidine kinase/ActR/RegA family two-component response regulator